ESIAVAAAMSGIVLGGLIGGPVITVLIRRFKLVSSRPQDHTSPEGPQAAGPPLTGAQREYGALKSIVVILVAMWLGSWVSDLISTTGITLPAYVRAMLVGAVIRNIDDATGWIGRSVLTTDLIGNVSLALFLSVALVHLQLSVLAGQAVPQLDH